MKRIFNKLGARVESAMNAPVNGNGASEANRDDSMFSLESVFRHRYQRGVNLGSWFVLERWIADEPFTYAISPTQSDIDIAHGPHAKEVVEKHWDSWIQNEDWDYMRDHGINAARIPIGYYHLCGADRSVLDGTDFYPVYEVYNGAWARITRAIARAAESEIGVLLDLHAAPGKQNHDAHAGTSGPANFFGDPRCTITALKILATHLKTFTQTFHPPLPNIIGVELLNEPVSPSDEPLKRWYRAAVKEIQSIDPGVPIYLGDCWRPETYANFIRDLHPSTTTGPLTVMDHHLYRCFAQSDISTPVPAHTRALCDYSTGTPKQLAEAAEVVGRAGDGLVVGEWSAAMNPGSLGGSYDEHREQQREWVEAQLALYDRVCAGWFFWTYKKQRRGDVGWSWRDAVEACVFPDFVAVRKREGFSYNRDDGKSKQALEVARKSALDQHIAYWAKYPGKYDHVRFSSGYTQGWHDALSFMSIDTRPNSGDSVNQIGFKAAWARKRTSDHGKSYWEYEAGFTQAVNTAAKWFASYQHYSDDERM
ncbi:hypothetical protein D9619_013609 [Psilocybe cf. subviscida]|uniref:Glycoside hydrolase family 5 domain-containing protein n=1 Tax=Psilocybe cf. subviscida TaxID=2480587 RepID=A0A8H5BR51_9AGAR|nr:hypothetical protein D9619_013609 [Psilocybe cf. subviscida]